MRPLVLAAVLVLVAPSCHFPPVDAAERHKALVRRWFDEGFNQRTLLVVDELFGEHVVINGQAVGRDGVKQSMRRHLAGFPNLHVSIDEVVAEGRKVSVWYTVEGVHGGEFEGMAPTNRRVKWTGVDLFTVDDGKITEARFVSDVQGLLAQLGASEKTK